MDRHPFRLAVEQDDLEAVRAMLHEDVEFRSPAVHHPYQGREVVAHLLAHAKATLEGLTYLDELRGGDSLALVFTARVGDRDVEGLDHLTFDGDGRITRFRVMIRPLSGLVAVAQTMGARLEQDPPPG
ncbi:MAG: nuclear transport factor 2 family protein [Nitriliruptoraceae bacterium]